ncbi:MAG: hypothetical protein ACTSQF_05685 [Candidatus Heimdallarchaeaceae archaeon]
MSVSTHSVMMISIALDLANKQKKTFIDYIGSISFPSGYFAHLLPGLDYTTFLPFIRMKPNRLFFIYWQPYTDKSLTLEYLTDLRSRLVNKYYVGDIMKVSEYYITDFKEKETQFISGTWDNPKERVRGIFETIALKHDDFLLLIDISTTEKDSKGKAIEELRNIRSSLDLL